MIVAHEIINLPSAATLDALRRETAGRLPAAKLLAILADPVFSDTDERLSADNRVKATRASRAINPASRRPYAVADVNRSTKLQSLLRDFNRDRATLARLLHARTEAQNILTFAPAAECKAALDFDANRANATTAELSQYRILHFATHSLLNEKNPDLSGIVLSLVNKDGAPQDGFLRLHEIYDLQLPADLVVLSACQTALGQEIRGEGLLGLTRGFMYAGAARVIASLWKVDDEATAELMSRFYKGMLGNRQLRPAEALRQAQKEMLTQNPWRKSPFFWAGFTLQGEWQ